MSHSPSKNRLLSRVYNKGPGRIYNPHFVPDVKYRAGRTERRRDTSTERGRKREEKCTPTARPTPLTLLQIPCSLSLSLSLSKSMPPLQISLRGLCGPASTRECGAQRGSTSGLIYRPIFSSARAQLFLTNMSSSSRPLCPISGEERRRLTNGTRHGEKGGRVAGERIIRSRNNGLVSVCVSE